MSAALFDRFLSTPAMTEVFGEVAVVQAMLDFEAALARAQAAEGVIPGTAAGPIVAACRVERFDLDAIVRDGSVTGTLVIPLVKQLTALVAADDATAAGFVHWGSTSQDVIDTAMVLATRRAVALIDVRLGDLTNALLKLVDEHGDAPMIGRTLMQPALVISFGFKLVAWVAPLVRARQRLRDAAAAALKLQLGGAVGTLSVMADAGAAVARRMADDLELGHSPGAWHTQRDEWVALGCEVGVLCGSLGKIARDISLLAQGEIAEVAEPSGNANGQKRGGSSAMPHKRNPWNSETITGLARVVRGNLIPMLESMTTWHERDLANSSVERVILPDTTTLVDWMLQKFTNILDTLLVYPENMQRNLEQMGGLVCSEQVMLALIATGLSREEAYTVAQRNASKAWDGTPFRDAIAADPTVQERLTAQDLEHAFDIKYHLKNLAHTFAVLDI